MNDDTNVSFDTLIVGQIEAKERWQKELAEIEKRKALNKPNATDRVAAAEAKQKIKQADEAIADLNKQRAELKTAESSEEQAATLAQEREIIDGLITQHNIGYLVKENKYAYCMGMEKSGSNVINPVFELVEANKFGRVLNKMAKKQLKLGTRHLADELADHFQRIHKDYFMATTSFNKEKWGKDKVYNRASIISSFWVEPNFEEMESYDKRFDFLIRCVGGAKQENIDHLEKWLAYKYLNPDRVGNTPNLDIGGYPGGNGKGRFVELMKTIFTNPCIIPAALKELMDGFNASWEMAITLYYDEPEQDELPEGKLKTATGGEDIRVERKGVDATTADRNFNILFLSNNPNGVVKLSGTGSSGEDRRYSVMVTNLVMVDEAIKTGLTHDEAKVYVNGINDLIKNRKEVAKWLAHIIMKHDVMSIQVLQPLHGADYRGRFNDQKTPLDNAFDLMMPVLIKNTVLPYEILKACVMGITGYDKLGDKKLKQDWKRYLEKNKLVVDFLEGTARPRVEYHYKEKNGEIVQKTCYALAGQVGASGSRFDFGDILKRAPTNMKLAKDTCEAKDMLNLEDE